MLVARPSSVYILLVDAALLVGRHTNSYDRARCEVDLRTDPRTVVDVVSFK